MQKYFINLELIKIYIDQNQIHFKNNVNQEIKSLNYINEKYNCENSYDKTQLSNYKLIHLKNN